MNKKILIIGQKSFIGSNLFKYLNNKKLIVNSISFEDFLKRYKRFKKFDFIINCTSNEKFVKKKHQNKNDYDLIIAKKITNPNTKFIMLSTRKVYQAKLNVKEIDKKNPKCNYSKNKLTSERLVKKIMLNRVLILRISNIIGIPAKNKRKLHKTFIDIFFEMAKKGIIYKNNNIFKDFISINKFNHIVFELIKKNSFGTYNISIGKKVYLDQLVSWLNYYNTKNIKIINLNNSFNDDCFTLNNKKLMKKIKIKNNISELKDECLRISKNYFN